VRKKLAVSNSAILAVRNFLNGISLAGWPFQGIRVGGDHFGTGFGLLAVEKIGSLGL